MAEVTGGGGGGEERGRRSPVHHRREPLQDAQAQSPDAAVTEARMSKPALSLTRCGTGLCVGVCTSVLQAMANVETTFGL